MNNDHHDGVEPSSLVVQQNALSIDAGRETAIAAVAAKAQAAIQSRITQALARPRDLATFRIKVLADCARPWFAWKAKYRVPRGNKKNETTGEWESNIIVGPSIKFAQAAVKHYGNAAMDKSTIYDDDEKRIIQCDAYDMEANVSWGTQIVVNKTVERKKLAKDQVPRGSRTNSYGDKVYLVDATEDDLAMKEGAQYSKAIRTCILRMLPADIVEEAMQLCDESIKKEDAKDPQLARNRLMDSFATLGVMPASLVEYLGGQMLDALTPAQLMDLRGLFVALSEGVVSWPDALKASPYVTQEDKSKEEDKRIAETKKKLDESRAKIAAKKASKETAKAEPTKDQEPEAKPEESKPTGKRPGIDEPPEDWQPTDPEKGRTREPGDD